jgi:hypothetical protein
MEKNIYETTAQDYDFETEVVNKISVVEQVKKHSALYYLRFLLLGTLFGIVLVKGEVISWFRIQEMFRFQSFHMYGVIGSAVLVGIISVGIIKKFSIKSIDGENISLPTKHFHKGQVFGGLPLFAQIGAGFSVVIAGLLSAVAGTWVYGLLQHKLPH